MARLTLWNIRYDPRHGAGTAPDVVVTLRGQAGGGEEQLPVAGADLTPGASVALHHGGFEMTGAVTVAIAPASGGAAVGTFEVPETATSAAAGGNWQAVQDDRHRYTVSYRVELEGRDVVDRGTYRPRICDASVARNSENCLTPGERGVAMATLHDREKLIYGTDPMVEGTRVFPAPPIPTTPPPAGTLRAAYVAAPGPILGPRHVDPAAFPGDAHLAAHGGHMVVAKRNDATAVFRSGARALADYYGDLWGGADAVAVHHIDNGHGPPLGPGHAGEGDTRPSPQRLADVLDVLRALAPANPLLSLVAFFCHGWHNGFQLGGDAHLHMGPHQTRNLADAIQAVAREDVVVALYACSTAGGNQANCFASRLRDALISGGRPLPACRVMGHTTAAHGYYSPDVRMFEGPDGAGAVGWDIAPAGHADHGRFVARVGRNSHWPAFRWAFPLMSREAIEAFLADTHPPADVFQEP